MECYEKANGNKFLIDNGNNQFTDGQKELIKHAVDQARTPQQLVEIIITSDKSPRELSCTEESCPQSQFTVNKRIEIEPDR